jgi:hypothetical protein
VQSHFDASEIELEHRDCALDALDHARRDRRQKKLRWVEGVPSPVNVGVENDLGILAPGEAAVPIGPLCRNRIFGHADPPSTHGQIQRTRVWEALTWLNREAAAYGP